MISAVLSVVIVNLLYRLYAKLIGADVMFYSGKKKLAAMGVESPGNRRGKLGAYVVLWAILFGTLGI